MDRSADSDEGNTARELRPFPLRNVVRGQTVHRIKLERSKELRQDMTPAERLLWSRLRAKQLEGWHFRRQQVIDGFIIDFYCNAAGVVVEVDGDVHETTSEYDPARDHHLQTRGLTLLRFTNEEVHTNMRAVLQRIAATCGESRRQH